MGLKPSSVFQVEVVDASMSAVWMKWEFQELVFVLIQSRLSKSETWYGSASDPAPLGCTPSANKINEKVIKNSDNKIFIENFLLNLFQR